VKRIIWLSLGAAGGIVAYRKGGQWLERARGQGVVVTAQQIAAQGRDALEGAQRMWTASTGRDERNH
jgi:hypothetical protein